VLVGIIIVAVLLVALVAMLVLKGRGVEGPAIAVKPERNTADLQPMTGLESALDQAMDRSGRNMRDKLESDTAIDELRIPDDTGPILRRALDHVEHRAQPQPGETPTAS
jgi:hypothetical protein